MRCRTWGRFGGRWWAVDHPFGLSPSKPGHPTPPVRVELVETGECSHALLIWLHAFAEDGGRESPGVRVTFFCFAKRKSPKKRRPPVCDPHAVRGGNLRRGGCGVRRGTRFALRAPLGQPRRVSSRSTRAPTRVPPRNRPAAGAASRGLGSRTSNGRTATRAIAALGRACAARGACAREMGPSAAQRSKGPCGCPLPGFPSVCAWGAQGAGWHARRSAHAS